MSVTAIARRYAEALADVATERNQIEQFDSELQAFVEMMTSSRELHGVFASPTISYDNKSRVLDALIERATPGQPMANLLRLLLRNDRLHNLHAVHDAFKRIVNERRGVVSAEVTAAGEMSAAEQEALRARLGLLTGKKVELQFKTDPSLIGGVVTRIGSVVYDGSIRTQLQEIKQRMKE
ncbi:MAG TPA: ATP synthase F1 subunit delta [Blastocatellia bacterium]|nr:ATP synthase F1 subunit delta [Blastocatellia bacterium]